MRLDVALVHGLGLEAAFDHHLGLGEAGLDVAQLDLELAGDVGGLAVEADVVVQDRGAGLRASSTSITQGSTSYSTSISFTAAAAIAWVVAATAATGWPGNSALSRAITLRDIQRMSWMPSITDLSIGNSTRSLAVMTAFTPGSAAAFEVSIDLIRACGCGLRSTLPQIMPGIWVSAAYAARPVTLSRPSGRRVPLADPLVVRAAVGHRWCPVAFGGDV